MGDPSYDGMKDWDPMQEAFYDESFNSYNTGAGSRLPRHQQPANFKNQESQMTKLYLFPLSERYTEDSLSNIFKKYGEVNEVYLHHSYRWAFVTMKSLAAAERAIRDMSNDPQLGFKVQYAKEKSNSVSNATSETGSVSEFNHQKNEVGSQFTDSSNRKSTNDRGRMAERSVTESSSERPASKSSHQKSTTMNGDVYQVVPNCCNCKCQTPDTCMKCLQPFCSIDCMIRGYKGHTSQCVRVPLHSSQKKLPSTNSEPINDQSPSANQDFSNSSRNQSSVGNSNSRKSNYLNDLGAKSQNKYDGRPATIPNSRAFETGGNDEQSSHNTAHDPYKNIDETCIDFNIAEDRKRNRGKERSRTFSRSNQESGSWNSETQGSGYHSKMDKQSRNRQSHVPGNRLSEDNLSSWNTRSQSKVNDLSRDNRRSRFSGNSVNNENELWENESQQSGYHSKKNDLSRDYRSRNFRGRFKDKESFPGTQSPVSGYQSERENTFSKDNQQSRVSRDYSNRENESAWETQSQVSAFQNRSYKKNGSTWSSQSSLSAYDSNKQSHEMGSTPQPNKHYNVKSDASPRSPKYEIHLSPKKKDLSSLFRVCIAENDKYEVRLAESGPPAVLIELESDSLNTMIDILQEFHLKPMEDFSKGRKCVVKKSPDDYGTWYRGVIVEADPLWVKFIDFSYERVKVRKEDVRMIPDRFLSINPYCYAVNFMNASSDEIDELKNTKFKVEFLSKEYGTWNVNLVEKPSKKELPQINSHRSLPDLKIVLKKGVPVKVFVTYVDTSSRKMFVTMRDKLEKLQALIGQISPRAPKLEELRLNTICLALYEQCWYRAKIISVDPLEVYFIDFGNFEPIARSKLRMLPAEFKEIDPLVVHVKFKNEATSQVNPEEYLEIIPVDKNASEIWIVRKVSESEGLESEDEDDTLVNIEESDNKSYAPRVLLGETMDVLVTYQISNTEYYVGPKNMDELLKMDITDEEVEDQALLINPSIGMLCVKMYDKVWCRAKIVELEPLTIYFIDFGNEEKVRIDDLYPLPKRLHAVPPLAFKIYLQEPKDLPEYEPLKLRKVTEKFWTTVDEF